MPQGSILGPLLFLIYINDLTTVSKALFTLLFADDTSLFKSGKDINVLIHDLNIELNNITNWLKANKLSLNTAKTHFMVISNKEYTVSNHVLFNDCVIDQVYETKFLGVMVDSKLTWKCHVNYISKKVSRGLGILTKARPFINANTCKTLYNCFIYPYLLYCNHIWGSACKTVLNPLYLLQKKAVRLICRSPYNAHTDELFRNLSVIKLFDIYVYVVSIFMFKFVSGKALSIYKSMFVYNFEIHSRETRYMLHFHRPYYRLSSSMRFIKNTGCVIWNKIAHLFVEPFDLKKMKNYMKTYLVLKPDFEYVESI